MKKYKYIGIIGTNSNNLQVGLLLFSNVSPENIKNSPEVDEYDFVSKSIIEDGNVDGDVYVPGLMLKGYVNLVDRLCSIHSLTTLGSLNEYIHLNESLDFGYYDCSKYGLDVNEIIIDYLIPVVNITFVET